MRCWPWSGNLSRRFGRQIGGRVALPAAFFLLFFLLPGVVFGEVDTRVMWQIRYAPGLSAAERDEVQASLMRTLSRAKERHFATQRVIEQKLRTEGLNLPSCFEDGTPCSKGGALFIEVHNVDAFVEAQFDRRGGEWFIDLTLYRRLSVSASEIRRSGTSLDALILGLVSALFEMESGIEITSSVPGVQIFMNQTLLGTAPLSMKIAQGPQSLTFKKDGYVSKTWNFEAEKGRVHAYVADLEPEKTQLTVLTNDPAALIRLNGQDWGQSNETKDILPGTHQIEVISGDFHPFDQTLRVYPGNPQTIHVALLPRSESPFTMRQRGIGKYRFSTTVGYRFGFQAFSLNGASDRLNGETVYPSSGKGWADTMFHGGTFALNYEAEYWGVSIFRLDLMGSGISDMFKVGAGESAAVLRDAQAKGAFLLGFYPAQLKVHYPFWVMQIEAVVGIGLSHLRLSAETGPGVFAEKLTFSRTAFSVNADFGLKYYMSEESFLMVSYGVQYDVESKSYCASSPRHGLTLALGIQLPFFMRDSASGLLPWEGVTEAEAPDVVGAGFEYPGESFVDEEMAADDVMYEDSWGSWDE